MAGDRRTSSTGRFANRVACRPKEKTKTNEGPPGDGTTRMQVDSPELRVESPVLHFEFRNSNFENRELLEG